MMGRPRRRRPAKDPDTAGQPEAAQQPERTQPGDSAAPSLRAIVEAVLLVADEPVPSSALAQVAERSRAEVEELLNELRVAYATTNGGFDLREIGGGWRFFTSAHCASYVERFVHDGRSPTLSRAALETLAIVAYRQPVTRAHVSAIRGVAADAVMRTLLGHGLVAETGVEPGTGAVLYGTTPYFLERLGLAGLGELPPLSEYLPDQSTDLPDDAAV